MNFNEKEKVYQEMIKNSPHLMDKFSPKKIEKKVESPLEKLKNLRKEKIGQKLKNKLENLFKFINRTKLYYFPDI